MHGIMYLAGQDKGVALRCVLTHSAQHYDKILFVDDTLKNNLDMEKAFKQDPDMTVLNVYFTKEHDKENRFKQSTEQQKQSYIQWRNIKNALRSNIQDPVF